MVLGLIASLGDLTDAELNELALAVAEELSRRAIGTTAAAEPAAEPVAAPSAAVAAYTTPFGRVWHRRRGCQHLRRATRVVEHTEPPEGMRCCRTCQQD